MLVQHGAAADQKDMAKKPPCPHASRSDADEMDLHCPQAKERRPPPLSRQSEAYYLSGDSFSRAKQPLPAVSILLYCANRARLSSDWKSGSPPGDLTWRTSAKS